VIGATDQAQLPALVDPTSLQVVASGGVKLTPTVIHRALRQKAGIDLALLERFPNLSNELPLFG
jgi:hypothetical protein